MMMKEIKKAVFTFLATLIFLGGIHMLMLEFVLPSSYTSIKLIYIYLFFFILVTLSIAGIVLVKKHNSEQLSNALLAITIINFLSSLVFLLPDLLNKDDYTLKFVYKFFGIFFPVLFVETLLLIGIVNNKQKITDEN